MEKRENKPGWATMLKAKIKARKFLMINRFKVFAWTHNGKKYLVVAETDWRGTKWKRNFEVVDELDENMNPIPFPGKEAVTLCNKSDAEKTGNVRLSHIYSYPKVGNLDDITVTDDRDTAISNLMNGYGLFTVPQMFGMERGIFTLVLPVRNHDPKQMSEDDARRALSDYENASRELYNSQ